MASRLLLPRMPPSRPAVVCALLLAATGCLEGSVVENLSATCEPACAAGSHCDGTTCVPDDPELCGNFALDAGEECDDGPDATEDDACGPRCRLQCGNGQLQAGEECDEGPENGADAGPCDLGCLLVPVCGDGTIDRREACDDGVANGPAGLCLESCAIHCPEGPFEARIVALAAGHSHLLLLDADGQLWGLGTSESGELGQGDDLQDHRRVVAIPAPATAAPIVSIATGWRNSFVIDQQGVLYGTGMNEKGSLGLGRGGVVRTLTELDAGPWRTISGGGEHTLGIKQDGTLWSWGDNTYGQLGTGTGMSSPSPVQVGDRQYEAIAAGRQHSLALRDDGTLLVFGSRSGGALGVESALDVTVPEPLVLPGGGAIRAIAAGYLWSMAVTEEGAVQVWGTRVDLLDLPSSRPERLLFPGEPPPRMVRVDSLMQAAVALDDAGRAHTWGISSDGQTGRGDGEPFRPPAQLRTPAVLEAATGGSYLALLVTAGTPEAPTARLLTAGQGTLAVLGRDEPASGAALDLGPVCR